MHKEIFDDVIGLGEKRKEVLRKHYPTLETLEAASESELRQIIPSESASALYLKLHPTDK
jgi:Nuclease subunit of the excinuclease complex